MLCRPVAILFDQLARVRIISRGRFRICLSIRMKRNRGPRIVCVCIETRLEKSQVSRSERWPDQLFIWHGCSKCAPNFQRQCVVLRGVGPRRPEHFVVWLVENLPDYAATCEVSRRVDSPTRERGASFRSAHRFAFGVKRIAVIENEEWAN